MSSETTFFTKLVKILIQFTKMMAKYNQKFVKIFFKRLPYNFPDEYLRKIIREHEKRVVIGFNENQFGEAVVTTAILCQNT